MVFSSTVFLFLFLPIVLGVYYNPFFKSRSFRNAVLLIASLGFYAWGEPIFVFVMIISIVITWVLGILIDKYSNVSKVVLTIGIVYHVLVLVTFKYTSFFLGQVGLLLNKDFSFFAIPLPIGISFFSFQLMSYLFDVYYKKAKVQKNLFYVGLYVSLFPQLVAGPIVRYEDIANEIGFRKESYDDVALGMKRFVYGLAKKVLLANYLARVADNSFDYLAGNTSVAMVWLGVICYSFQIYYDFSGYSDMAIGLGRMFGFHFNENFDYPYMSKSMSEFWRRWHISLGTWFKDYVYFPLGGNRVGKARWVFNVFLVWLLTGLWHGANWTYIVWGMMIFTVLLAEKMIGYTKKLKNFSHIYTVLMVVFSFVIFRASSIGEVWVYFGNMFGIGATTFADELFLNNLKSVGLVLSLSIIGLTPLTKNMFARLRNIKCAFLEDVWLMIVFIISILQVISSTYNPFIYFNF